MQIRNAIVALIFALPAFAQYNAQAGRSTVAGDKVTVETRDAKGAVHQEQKTVDPTRDAYGNASAEKYDLAVDGAFSGQTVMVVDLYGGEYGLSFEGPRAALESKGFSVVHYNQVPSVAELEKGLAKSSQFWIVSSCDNSVHLTPAHQKAIKKFFDAGHGVYLWGDNDPCNADADKLAAMLIDARVQGDLPGDQTVGISKGAGKPGVVRDHLLSTGVEHVYEGVTVATVKPAGAMTPVIYGSAGNLVAAAYERDGKRLIVDGGFTRLTYKWDTAGTGRYIRNAGAWLANHERFGDEVVAEQFRKK
jgi:hypothetical protein